MRGVVVWACLAGLACPALGQANTYYVATNGNDTANNCTAAQNINTPKRNIMGANGGLACITAAGGAPHTLDIRAGTYTETISHQTQTIPPGTSNSNRITIRGHVGETVTIAGGLDLGASTIHFVTFDNLIIDATGLPVGMYLGNSTSNIQFLHGEIKNAVMNIQGGGTNAEIAFSHIHDAGFDGVGDPCTGELAGCYGIYWGGSNSVFHHNHWYNNAGHAIHTNPDTNMDNNTWHSNLIYNNGFFDGDRGFNDMAQALLAEGNNTRFYNNIVYNGLKGVQVNDTTNSLIDYNTIHNHTFNCLYAYNSSGDTFRNNICSGTGAASYTDSTTLSATFTNILCPVGTPDSVCTEFGTPDYVNVAALDFRLQSTSDAIDSGATIAAIPLDYAGTTRAGQGTAPDIGALEFLAADTTPPSDVTGLTATTLSSTVIQLNGYSASDASGIAGFHTERCSGVACNSSFTNLGNLASGPQQDTGLTPGLVYGYRMKAVDASPNANESTNWFGPIYATTFATFPAVPTSASLSMAALSFPTAPTGPSLTLSPVTPPAAPTGGSLSMPALSFPTAPTAPTLGVVP